MIQGTGLLLHKHALSGQGEFDLLHNLLMACTPVCVLESGKWFDLGTEKDMTKKQAIKPERKARQKHSL
eukprot:scaffold210818_cov21-Tisochrysis_lutea.AAC.4